MIRTIIIDDEVKSKETLLYLLKENCKNISVIGQGFNVKSAIEVINKYKPELVFLDINLPDGTGFDILKKQKKINFKIIFITAYNEYAVKAFKFSAIDYLLKPIVTEELIEAVNKVVKYRELEELDLKYKNFLNNISTSKENHKIVLRTSEGMYIVNVNDIMRCESDRNYTTIYLTNKKTIVTAKTLSKYEELFKKYNFYRVHQSHLINLSHVISYEKKNYGTIVMSDYTRLPVSSRKKNDIIDIINNL